MKKIIIFVAVGLLVGLAGGSFLRGTKERDVILARMAAEKAVADSLRALEEDASSHEDQNTGAADELTLPAGVDGSSGEAEAGGESGGAGVDTHEADRILAEETEGSREEAIGEPVTDSPEEDVPSGGGLQAPSAQSDSTEGPARMAKIFGAMEAKDAAAVLSNLSDAEVQSILKNMSERKVARILEEFAPERAASLSRVVLAARAGIGE